MKILIVIAAAVVGTVLVIVGMIKSNRAGGSGAWEDGRSIMMLGIVLLIGGGAVLTFDLFAPAVQALLDNMREV